MKQLTLEHMDIDTLERLVRNCTNGIRTVNDIKASQELAELRQKAQIEIQKRYTRGIEGVEGERN